MISFSVAAYFFYVWCFSFLQMPIIGIPISRICPSSSSSCIDIWKCPHYVNLLHRSESPRPFNVIWDIRRNLCGFVNPDTPKVCCATTTQQQHAPAIISSSTTTTTLRPKFDRMHSVDRVEKHKNFNLLPFDDCGQVMDNFRITSGTETEIGEFPWMALILYDTDDGLDFRCGGSLINERYVLTAAHCIDNSTIRGVRLGEHNLMTDDDCDQSKTHCAPPVQDFLITETIVHPHFDARTFLNDIALIRLATPANFSFENVQPICLLVADAADDKLTGETVTVTGWGVTESGDKSAILLKTTMPVLPVDKCKRLYQRHKPITRNQICAGGVDGRDSCAGDSGGPLTMIGTVGRSSRYVQLGIVSYGPKLCGIKGRPGIYTKVPEYLVWILDHLER